MIAIATLTPIISGLTSALAATKSFLELRTTLKSLFRKEPQLSKAFDNFHGEDKRALIGLYNAIEIGKEVTDRIQKKVLIKFLINVAIIAILLVTTIICVQFIDKFQQIICALIFPVVCYILISQLCKNPLRLHSLGHARSSITESVERLQHMIKSTVGPVHYQLSNVYSLGRWFSFFAGVTRTERLYLERFLALCSLRDTIEMYFVSEKAQTAMADAFVEPKHRDVVVTTIADSIVSILEEEKGVQENREKVIQSITNNGLADWLKLINNDQFFQMDFQKEYATRGINGVKLLILQFVP